MRNEKERHAFIDNADNWEIAAELAEYLRIKRVQYKGEYRFALEVYEEHNTFNYEISEPEQVEGWVNVGYYKISDLFPALERQSLSQVRKWISDLDRSSANG